MTVAWNVVVKGRDRNTILHLSIVSFSDLIEEPRFALFLSGDCRLGKLLHGASPENRGNIARILTERPCTVADPCGFIEGIPMLLCLASFAIGIGFTLHGWV
jgi:chorismate-pyruvate lyase